MSIPDFQTLMRPLLELHADRRHPTKGIFITTSSFSTAARELARRRRIVLLDGLELAEHMVDVGVGVTTLQTYELKRIDEDYFPEVE